MLYVSFYVHHSIFTELDKSTWRLEAHSNVDSTVYPLLTLFGHLKLKPYQKAEFNPQELDPRKRLLNLDVYFLLACSYFPGSRVGILFHKLCNPFKFFLSSFL